MTFREGANGLMCIIFLQRQTRLALTDSHCLCNVHASTEWHAEIPDGRSGHCQRLPRAPKGFLNFSISRLLPVEKWKKRPEAK